MSGQNSNAAERLLLSFAGVAAAYTDALADYTHRVRESTRNLAFQSAGAATPVEACEALVPYLVQQYSETIAFTGKLLNSERLENDLPIERGCFAPRVKEAAS